MNKIDFKALAMDMVNARGKTVLRVWAGSIIFAHVVLLPVLAGLGFHNSTDVLLRNFPIFCSTYLGALAVYAGSKAYKLHKNGGGK